MPGDKTPIFFFLLKVAIYDNILGSSTFSHLTTAEPL